VCSQVTGKGQTGVGIGSRRAVGLSKAGSPGEPSRQGLSSDGVGGRITSSLGDLPGAWPGKGLFVPTSDGVTTSLQERVGRRGLHEEGEGNLKDTHRGEAKGKKTTLEGGAD